MYISMDGEIIRDKLQGIKDTLDFNFMIDINDIPMANFGITQSVSKSNRSDMEEFLRLTCDTVLNNNGEYLSGVSLTSISMSNTNINKYVIGFRYQGQDSSTEVNV